MNTSLGNMYSGAIFSADGIYRYQLWRRWPRLLPTTGGNEVAFICLNPSTADEWHDDPTVRRCIRFAQLWGYTGMYVLNIFAFRATHPEVLRSAENPVGEDDDAIILRTARSVRKVIAAWGVHGKYQDRERHILRILRRAGVRLYHLGLTSGGHPRHPLYLRGDTIPMAWGTEPRG